MKKTNQLLFIAGLSIAALCGCQYDAALKQQNARTVAKLEYNLSYTQTPKEQIAIAAEILTIDNNNNTALNVMMSFFNKPEFQKEIYAREHREYPPYFPKDLFYRARYTERHLL